MRRSNQFSKRAQVVESFAFSRYVLLSRRIGTPSRLRVGHLIVVFRSRRNLMQGWAIDSAKLREYLADPTPSAAVKAALTKAISLHAKLANLSRQWTEQDLAAANVAADQARLRENLKIIPQTAEPFKRFLEKFVAQESEIEGLRQSIRQTRIALAATQRECDAGLANLNVE